MATVSDLAASVLERLDESEGDDPSQRQYPVPSLESLTEIFRTVFYASLKSEEGRSVQVRLYYINPDLPDPFPPIKVRINRWRTFALDQIIQLTIPNLVKLAKAADPWITGIAIYEDDERGIFIWGLVDQVLHLSTAIVRENTKGRYPQPGAFHVSVNGPGDMTVMKSFAFVARLSQDQLFLSENDCLQRGYVSKLIASWLHDYWRSTSDYCSEEATLIGGKNACVRIAHTFWTSTISRILIHIQRQRHGGALLITNDIEALDLRSKYAMNYDRLAHGLHDALIATITRRAEISRRKNGAKVSLRDISVQMKAQMEREDRDHMISGAVRFVSSLAGVDGLVVLTPDLLVHSFATLISTEKTVDTVVVSKDFDENNGVVQPVTNFGTRHGSMIQFCSAHPGSLGLVISQDGDVRAITNVNGTCTIFDGVKVYNTWGRSVTGSSRIS